jgi:hypothetical protein
MLNEAKYRSPKWLRNYVDFEVNTGSDITGEKSKKQLKDEARQKEEEDKQRKNKEWDRRWEEMYNDSDLRNLFEKFFEETYPDEFKYTYNSMLFLSNLRDIKNIWRNKWEIWDKYDSWIENKRKMEADKRKEEERIKKEQERIDSELKDLYYKIMVDFTKSPWTDKFRTHRNGKGGNKFYYTLDDGEEITLEDNVLTYKTKKFTQTFTLGILWRNKFTGLANHILTNCKKRGEQQRSSSGSSSSGGGYRQEKPRPDPNAGHPKFGLYTTLKKTIKQREDQLAKMSKNDPERVGLENELNAAKRRVADMKTKYKFENLTSFNNYVYTK